MLHAFGQGVPESWSLAAALFSLAAAQGHAQAAQMLESIQLTSTELPNCVTQAQLPEKTPAAIFNGLRLPPSLIGNASIDRFLRALPPHKRWVIPLATTLSAWYALDPKLVLSVIAVESNFETGAQSPKAATGLMQLIPDTAERFNVRNAFNASQNLRGGMRYLRWLQKNTALRFSRRAHVDGTRRRLLATTSGEPLILPCTYASATRAAALSGFITSMPSRIG